MYRKRQLLLFSVLVIGLLALSACQGSGAQSCGPDLPISETAARRIEQKVVQAAQTSPGSPIRVTVTDEEATSYINLRMNSQTAIERPQVRFEQGQVCVSGKLTRFGSIQPMVVARGNVTINDGQVTVNLTNATANGIPVPSQFIAPLVQIANDYLHNQNLPVNVQTVDIVPGQATVMVALKPQ
ncbi:MAG: hypothetical protein EXR62_04550 [Chloroflexi bacterium]|nr:hypothetical protein [Chloroflexota bacterium]